MDETITSKEQWYDLKPYKDEIASFIRKKRTSLDCISRMEKEYNRLYRTVYAGTEESDTERFPHSAEIFKVYKAAIIESCLQGYSALFVPRGKDAYSVLKIPELNEVMIDQFKSMALIENLTDESLDDWILKGEACGFIKLKTTREEYRIKETLADEATGEPIVKFTLKEGVEYEDIDFERIDPLAAKSIRIVFRNARFKVEASKCAGIPCKECRAVRECIDLSGMDARQMLDFNPSDFRAVHLLEDELASVIDGKVGLVVHLEALHVPVVHNPAVRKKESFRHLLNPVVYYVLHVVVS